MVPNFQQKPYTKKMTLITHIFRKLSTVETNPIETGVNPPNHFNFNKASVQEFSVSPSPCFPSQQCFDALSKKLHEKCRLRTFLFILTFLPSVLVSAEDKASSENKAFSESKVFAGDKTFFEEKTSAEDKASSKDRISAEDKQKKKENKFQLLPRDVFFQPGGGVRLRYDYLDAFGSAFPENRKTSEMSHQALMDIKLYKGEYIETFFRLIYFSERKTDFSAERQGASFANSGLIVNQAWAFWKIDSSFGLRFGRLPIHIGLGYTYGSNDWFNVPYSFDLVDLVWDWKSISLSLIAAKVADLGDRNPRFQGFRGNERHIIMSLDIQDLFKTLDIFNLSFIQVNRDPSHNNEKSKLIFNGLNVQRFGLETEIKGRHFFGSVFVSHVIGEENVVKTNGMDSEGKKEVSQSAFDLKLGYYLTGLNDLKFWLGYHHDTGDKSSTDKNSQGFDSFYYEVYGQSGFMDFIRWGNLSFLRAGLDMNLKEDWLLGMEWFNFSRTESGDAVHFGQTGGSLNTGVQTGNITLGSGNNIGNELDIFTNLNFGSGVHIRTTISAFLPGNILKETTASSGSLPHSTIYQCLTQVGYSF